ncbi:MAG: cyclic nucleotide-binding domain-containing protein, partial [bacterium]|nr:cyclic nucleotide-binding domain-containing protein [bacterium]
TLQDDDERNKSLARLRADMNIVVGETSLFDDGRRTATVRAVTDVTLGCITRIDLMRHCQHHPEFGYRIFYNMGKILSKRLANANINMLKISTAFVLALERGR